MRTAALLARTDAARWVHYKLDRGLDHILVDEAQDTSPRQWQVIRALVEEFFAGEGAGAELRTLFAVGDEKQSIFSFQGAVPAWFARDSATRRYGRGRRLRLEQPELHLSFRSVPMVLEAVDAVFADAGSSRPDRGAGGRRSTRRGAEPAGPRRRLAGAQAAGQARDGGLGDPVDHLGRTAPRAVWPGASPRRSRAGSTAARRSTRRTSRQPAPIRAGGILILTRGRGALTDAINRALKSEACRSPAPTG